MLFHFNFLQVVRYHSLVIDPESLPKELIPIAWTSTPDALPFLGTQKLNSIPETHDGQTSQHLFVNRLSIKLQNGKVFPSYDPEKINSDKVLMGIMHTSWPHYGLQVGFLLGFMFRLASVFYQVVTTIIV